MSPTSQRETGTADPARLRPALELDAETIRAIEVHEVRAYGLGGRVVQDFGDCVLLHDPRDPDPFWNRLQAVRWPVDRDAFDRRLGEVVGLFGSLGRRPHVATAPAYNTPPDLPARLEAHGFQELASGWLMVLIDPPDDRLDVEPGVTVERFHRPTGRAARRAADDLALVMVEGFELEPKRRATLREEILASFRLPESHACLVRVGRTPVAAARRTTFDGLSYLSSIATRPAWRGRGFGSLATRAVTIDALAEGSRWTYLWVLTTNAAARRLYERLGFRVVGGPAFDFLLG
ncbi:MAG TPA: GNAT family N-acetyltransferase [Candidatus Limnocylindrales bacterium]|nr:GNAT family N-acetyltransferase [Candidatus Limnocylindrales bacterium]